jgi:hypothetical protein
LYLSNGLKIPTYNNEKEKDNNYYKPKYAEYVVYNENLVRVKYIVEIGTENK